jgi:hypothetical protein
MRMHLSDMIISYLIGKVPYREVSNYKKSYRTPFNGLFAQICKVLINCHSLIDSNDRYKRPLQSKSCLSCCSNSWSPCLDLWPTLLALHPSQTIICFCLQHFALLFLSIPPLNQVQNNQCSHNHQDPYNEGSYLFSECLNTLSAEQ